MKTKNKSWSFIYIDSFLIAIILKETKNKIKYIYFIKNAKSYYLYNKKAYILIYSKKSFLYKNYLVVKDFNHYYKEFFYS